MLEKDAIENPDEDLRAAVLDALSRDESLAGLDLRVGVLNGIVHLAGSAPTKEIWEKAEQTASQVPGVRAVVNRIEATGAPSPARAIHLNLDSSHEKGEEL